MNKSVIVSGGAGFIGSNIVRELIKMGYEVHIFDNFSTGRLENVDTSSDLIKIYEFDLTSDVKFWPKVKALKFFHLAANADVRGGINNLQTDFVQNALVTKSVCDYAVENKIQEVIFSSSATVYGEPDKFPTKEDHKLIQTSVYGASKLAGEAYLQAYSEYGYFKSTIFRFVSWTGKGYSHGVIYDFVKKLIHDPNNLEILGDGKQTKSYLDVSDGVAGVINLSEKHKDKTKIFNLGHYETLNVIDLADIVCDEMGLNQVKYYFKGGKRGWIGDSPLVHLDTSLAQEYGWQQLISIEKSIRTTVKYLLEDEKRLLR